MKTQPILDIPFDELKDSKVAYDYSKSRKDGIVSGDATFVPGKKGSCIEFKGAGECGISQFDLDMNGDFSIVAWVNCKEMQDAACKNKLGVCVVLSGDDYDYRDTWFNIPKDAWRHWAIVKKGFKVFVYLDAQLMDTLNLPKQPTDIFLLQDIYNEGSGIGCVDDLKIFQEAMEADDIVSLISDVKQLNYIIDGHNFKEFGVVVSDSEGLLDRPKLKTPLKKDWAEYHGEIVDLEDKRVQPRDISLHCFMMADGKSDMAVKMNNFLDIFQQNGTQRLVVDIHPTKPLIYEVYMAEGCKVSKRWRDTKMAATFTLKLREPDPVKRILRWQKVSKATSDVNIELATNKMLTISWGDGTYSYNVSGDHMGTKKITHTYQKEGIYYVVISGVIEEITAFNTNAIVVWKKL